MLLVRQTATPILRRAGLLFLLLLAAVALAGAGYLAYVMVLLWAIGRAWQ